MRTGRANFCGCRCKGSCGMRRTRRTFMKSKSTILVGLAVVLGVSYAIASRQGAVNKPDDSDWLYVDHDLAGTRYSPLKQITTKNVSQLTKACAYTFPDKEPSQT